MTSWDGSVTIITGASRGIGAALARLASARGARLGLIARSKDELEQVLSDAGGDGALAAADVGDRAQVSEAIASLERELGPATILVNNAGIGAHGFVHDMPAETFEHLMRVNYLGTVYATTAVLPGMVARRAGHIVNIASIAGRIGAPLEGAYSATKFAVAGLSEALALEGQARGIKVTMVNPGPVETGFFDERGAPYSRKRPKPISAEVVARAVIAAVERDRAEIFLPRWLRFPVVLKAVAPALFRAGTFRDFRDELRVRD